MTVSRVTATATFHAPEHPLYRELRENVKTSASRKPLDRRRRRRRCGRQRGKKRPWHADSWNG
jgi:hypothetical protein